MSASASTQAMANKRGNFIYLLVGLVGMLFASAMAKQFAGVVGHTLLQLVVVLSLGLSVFSVHNPKLFRVGVFIVFLESMVGLASFFSLSPSLHLLELLLMGIFFVGMATIVMRKILFTGIIDNNKIVGAICVYLLLGMIWAVIYDFTLDFGIGAFNNMGSGGEEVEFVELLYFSFVTLSTLGFGDISPITPVARFFVYMEALIGQFYLAIMVASLIGAKFSNISSKKR